MKRGTPNHPKVTRLMRALNIGRAQAVGHLQMLWEWVGDYATDGDITEYEVEAAAGAAWEGDPSTFIESLVKCRLVDRVNGRLTIHDWEDHAEDYIRKRLERKRQRTAEGGSRASANGGQREPHGGQGQRESACQAQPGPHHSHSPTPAPSRAGADQNTSVAGGGGVSMNGDRGQEDLRTELMTAGVNGRALDELTMLYPSLKGRDVANEWEACRESGGQTGALIARLRSKSAGRQRKAERAAKPQSTSTNIASGEHDLSPASAAAIIAERRIQHSKGEFAEAAKPLPRLHPTPKLAEAAA